MTGTGIAEKTIFAIDGRLKTYTLVLTMNELFKQHGLEKLEDVKPEHLNVLTHGCFPDAREVTIVDKVLKRVCFSMGSAYFTLFGDNTNGDRFIQFDGDARYLKVNKSDRFDELDAQDKAAKEQHRLERAAKAAAKAAAPKLPKRTRASSDSGCYPVDRSFTAVAPEDIKVGDILLLRFGNGSQLFVVDSVSGPKGLLGRRLNNRGTGWVAWCVPGDSKKAKSWISRFDPRILGLGKLVHQDPKP